MASKYGLRLRGEAGRQSSLPPLSPSATPLSTLSATTVSSVALTDDDDEGGSEAGRRVRTETAATDKTDASTFRLVERKRPRKPLLSSTRLSTYPDESSGRLDEEEMATEKEKLGEWTPSLSSIRPSTYSDEEEEEKFENEGEEASDDQDDEEEEEEDEMEEEGAGGKGVKDPNSMVGEEKVSEKEPHSLFGERGETGKNITVEESGSPSSTVAEVEESTRGEEQQSEGPQGGEGEEEGSGGTEVWGDGEEAALEEHRSLAANLSAELSALTPAGPLDSSPRRVKRQALPLVGESSFPSLHPPLPRLRQSPPPLSPPPSLSSPLSWSSPPPSPQPASCGRTTSAKASSVTVFASAASLLTRTKVQAEPVKDVAATSSTILTTNATTATSSTAASTTTARSSWLANDGAVTATTYPAWLIKDGAALKRKWSEKKYPEGLLIAGMMLAKKVKWSAGRALLSFFPWDRHRVKEEKLKHI